MAQRCKECGHLARAHGPRRTGEQFRPRWDKRPVIPYRDDWQTRWLQQFGVKPKS
jgi:hypothetical protein